MYNTAGVLPECATGNKICLLIFPSEHDCKKFLYGSDSSFITKMFSIFLYLNILLVHLCPNAHQLTLFLCLQCLSVSWTEAYQWVTVSQQYLVYCCLILVETSLSSADSYAVLDRSHPTRFKWQKFRIGVLLLSMLNSNFLWIKHIGFMRTILVTCCF